MSHTAAAPPVVDPWRLELVVVKGATRSGSERGAIARDVQRGLLRRLGPGVYVERTAFDALTIERAHLVRMRANAATSPGAVVFSHWSAAVLLGLPVLRQRLDRVHVTVPEDDDRHRVGVAHHFFPLEDAEAFEHRGLLTTGIERTVLDIAGAAALEESAITADAALRAGVPRAALEAAVDLAGPRRASRRIAEAVAFAHAGSESAAESRARVSAYRLGLEVPELQHRIVLENGREAFLDQYYAGADAALEVDGDAKYIDTAMAPRGAAAAVIAEKRREDEVRTRVRALARVGWRQSGDPSLLRPVLWRIGVRRPLHRPAFEEWCAVAQAAQPRR